MVFCENMVEVTDTIELNRLRNPSVQSNKPDNLFNEISLRTGAWLCYEPGNKDTKEEPCIKIGGSRESVNIAKDMLLDRLEKQSNRVVMKMDVAHPEHPSLIGRGGRLIKQVMEVTGCHIHFPDINKKPTREKNNQVSIYGEPINVERAKVLIRALMPLQFYFEVPAASDFRPVLETAPAAGRFLAKHRGLVLHAARGAPRGAARGGGAPVVVVRCDRDQYPALRRDIAALMELVCNTSGANLPPVHVLTDVAAHHVTAVRESGAEEIAQRTGAAITFPDVERGAVVQISGNLDCVYMAWQEVMNTLPASISFDLNETRETDGYYKDFLQDCGIRVKVFTKSEYYIKNVTVKGPEKLTKQMLQYRQHLLQLPNIDFKRDIHDMHLAASYLAAYSQDARPSPSPSECSPSPFEDLFRQLSGAIAALLIESSVPRIVCAQEARETELNFNGNSKAFLFTNNNWMRKAPLAEESVPGVVEAGRLRDNDFPLAEDYYRKKLAAAQAMRRPIQSTQTPSSEWVGWGFSRSMPAAVIKEGLVRRSSPIPFPVGQQQQQSSGSRSSSVDSETWEMLEESNCLWSRKGESPFSHSNYFDFLRMPPLQLDEDTKLQEVLWQNGLHKYIDLFAKQEVDYPTFLMLTEKDLHCLGIEGTDRRKLVCLIRELQTPRTLSRTFDAAPGSHRKPVDALR